MAAAGGPTAEEKQAIEVAKALINEMEFPNKKVRRTKEDADLLDEPPPRSKLGFQQRKNPNPKLEDAAKAEMSRPIADQHDDADVKNLFCMVHCEFARLSGVDIEHGVAFEQITKKQITMLDFLNNSKNQEFTRFFLDQPGIKDLFGKDKGKIKRTRFFYRACYNNLKNLWLVCHACNIEKTAKDPLEWFSHQEQFGAAFVASIAKNGGLHSGVVFNAVGGREIAELGGQKICSGGKGLGEYAREWFLANHGQLYEANKQYYRDNFKKFQAEFKQIEQLWRDGDIDRADHKFKLLQKNMRLGSKLLHPSSPLHDSSSEDERLSQEERRQEMMMEVRDESEEKRHDLNKLEGLIKRQYPHDETDIKGWFKAAEESTNRAEITSQEIKAFRASIEDKLSSPSPLPNWNIFKEDMKKSINTLNKVEKLAEKTREAEREAKLRQEAELRAQDEARRREATELRAQDEVRRREESDRQAQEANRSMLEAVSARQALEQEFAALKEATSSSSLSSNVGGNASQARLVSAAASSCQMHSASKEAAPDDTEDVLMLGNPRKRRRDATESDEPERAGKQRPEDRSDDEKGKLSPK